MPPFKTAQPIREEDVADEVCRNAVYNVAVCKQQLYDLVQLNIKPGEIVEIYSQWCHGRRILDGLPVEYRAIDAEEILTSEWLNLEDKVMVEIHRTV
jgi:hypothetical protein